MTKFLQLLIGGIHDAIEGVYKGDAYSQAVSFACLGIFPNIGTIIVLTAFGVHHISGSDRFSVPFQGASKVLWLLIMVVVIIILLLSKDRIMAEDRIRFSSKLRRRIFLVAYSAFSFIAVIASFAAIAPSK